MAQDPRAALRAKLTFEQQSRFDALYDRQAKKQGAATVFSLPVLGTFGLEQFYLGNVGQGILRLLFSWTLIPTVLALFEILSGDLKKQVAHANTRVAKRVYDEVIKNTPSATTAPPDVISSVITPSAVAEAAAFAAEVPIAPPADTGDEAPVSVAEIVITTTPEPAATTPTDTTTDAVASAPVAAEVAEIDTTASQEDVATTTAGSFTVTESAAVWQQGMDAPVVASDEQTYTLGSSSDNVTDGGATTTAFVAEEAAPAPAASPDSDAEPLLADAPSAADTAPLAEEGVLVFVADEEPLTTDTFTTTTVTTPDETLTATVTEHVEQQQQADSVAIAEAEHVETQHYHHGKLVEASRHDIKLTGEVNALLTDTTTDTLVQEVETRVPASGWLDVSPLHSGDSAPTADVAAPAPASDAAPAPTSDATPVTTADAPTGATVADAGTTPAATANVALPNRFPNTPDNANGDTADGGGSSSGTDVPSGGLSGSPTDVPGGAVGDPSADPGTNVPAGGINTPPATGGDSGGTTSGDEPAGHHPKDGPIPN